jgi:hypothetical protein
MIANDATWGEKIQKKCGLTQTLLIHHQTNQLRYRYPSLGIYISLHIFNNFLARVMFCNRRLRAKFFMQIFNSGFSCGYELVRQTAPFCSSEAKMAG